jgi:hypothetical protein
VSRAGGRRGASRGVNAFPLRIRTNTWRWTTEKEGSGFKVVTNASYLM